MKITLITDNGIGSEIADATRRCIDATGADIDWEIAEADKLEKAAISIMADGKDVAYDMKSNRDEPTAVGTKEMADTIIQKIKSL